MLSAEPRLARAAAPKDTHPNLLTCSITGSIDRKPKPRVQPPAINADPKIDWPRVISPDLSTTAALFGRAFRDGTSCRFACRNGLIHSVAVSLLRYQLGDLAAIR